ncbi:MAG: hypothetical protein GX320_03045 [Tissierellia bacterium]|nr:hypothetical protein [Tissierellia bacterium]
MYGKRRNRGRYIPLFILVILALVVALNFGKIKFMFNMIKSYMNIGQEDFIDENGSLKVGENPLLSIIEKGGEEAKIAAKFNDNFELMKSDYEAKLDSLIRVGYEEYKSGEVSTPKLANKLLKEGSRLEKECDNDFNAMIKEMEKELKANNHDTEVIKDLNEYYDSYKKAEKNQLMRKAKEHMD